MRLPSGIICFGKQCATSTLSDLAFSKLWSQSTVQRFPVRHNTAQLTVSVRAVRPSAASEKGRRLINLVEHRKSSWYSRCHSSKLLANISASSTFQFFRQAVPVLQLSPSNAKSGQARLRGAHQPAQQSSLAARHSQCTHNSSLNRTFCGGPRLGYKILAQTQPTAKCRLALR